MTRAHGGVLFIDEIGEMDPALQARLLKVLEDKRVTFESSYYDESAPNVPEYVKRLFREGAPADFILIGATTRDPDDIDPAIRSRCAEIYFRAAHAAQVVTIVQGAIKRLGATRGARRRRKLDRVVHDRRAQSRADRRRRVRPGALPPRVPSRSAAKTSGKRSPRRITEGRRDACARADQPARAAHARCAREPRARSARAFGLGVLHYLGSIIEIEAVAFPASQAGKGVVRFNETAGSMAKDSVFNATSVAARDSPASDVADFDLHINVVGGGNIDGPSAGPRDLSRALLGGHARRRCRKTSP